VWLRNSKGCFTIKSVCSTQFEAWDGWDFGAKSIRKSETSQKCVSLLGRPPKGRFLGNSHLKEEILTAQVDPLCFWRRKNLWIIFKDFEGMRFFFLPFCTWATPHWFILMLFLITYQKENEKNLWIISLCIVGGFFHCGISLSLSLSLSNGVSWVQPFNLRFDCGREEEEEKELDSWSLEYASFGYLVLCLEGEKST